MKLVIVAAVALAACAAAAPAATPVAAAAAAPAAAPVAAPASAPADVTAANKPVVVVKILRSEFEQEPDGKYNYEFETEDGTSRQEAGEVKTLTNAENEPVDVVVVKGSYAYTDPEGVKHTVTYYADETGFHSDDEPKA